MDGPFTWKTIPPGTEVTSELRTWRDRTGHFTTQAALVAYRRPMLTLKRVTGETFRLSLSQISKQDRAALWRLLSAQGRQI